MEIPTISTTGDDAIFNEFNNQAVDEQEKKRASARQRKAASRARIMNDPNTKKAALEAGRIHSQTYNKKNKKEKLDTLITEDIEPARKKWDKAYSNRRQLLGGAGSSKTTPSATPWLERPLEQREIYNVAKKEERYKEKINSLEIQLQHLKANTILSNGITVTNAAVFMTEKQRFLIDEMMMDTKFVKSFNEERLTYIYIYMDILERSSELYAKRLSYNDVVTTIAAEKLCEAGSMMEGSGFFAVEACNADAARSYVFSPEEMVRVTVETSCNLSNLGHVAECQKNFKKSDCGFMYKKNNNNTGGIGCCKR